MAEILKIRPGDVLEMKKKHPCGSTRFEVLRVGTDIRIVCLGCKRDVTVPRVKLERSVRRVIPGEEIK